MIAVDTNILVYAHRRGWPFHEQARAALSELFARGQPWAIAWPSIHEFFAVMTNPRASTVPVTSSQCVAQIDELMRVPHLRLMGEGPSHWQTLTALLKAANLQGPMVHDARIAAICLQHGVREFWTADRDFSRFPSLNCRNPLIAAP